MNTADTEEFEQFVRVSSPGLLRTAWLLCGDPHRAEEMVQESLERVYLRWGRVRRGGQPLAYTRRVLINVNTDRWRRTHEEVLTYDGWVAESAAVDDSAVGDRDQVIRLLRLLPPREREVVVLRHYADMSERDVADLLQVSVGTVKSTASRGLSTLRAALTEQES
ncbi:SigE family RNA polymerase sigma factor [Allobranchiibius sp. GilTou73]|uniref:SigE family RNA polymerase sigma factor n=1 Tax=Allobranchiibius sp. GilTou73 TaxID=2904523 RepID=UPI001F360480|nr:SigE family RNA polymerase sigma factor [Allobranchiibius sp. GilTou73]UIJ34936.1 SigE family RNA polymerase sigma factor [Allobranchiibius sp. GilTou73]